MIAGGFLFSHGGADNGILLNLLFYIIITPVISLTLTKLMFMSENGMIVQDIQWKCQYEDALIQPARIVMDVCMGEYAAGNRD